MPQAMPFQRNAGLFTPRRRPQYAPETDFRHAGLASPEPYRMNAAFMLLGRRERGIHAV
jgi:hypothetical protein